MDPRGREGPIESGLDALPWDTSYGQSADDPGPGANCRRGRADSRSTGCRTGSNQELTGPLHPVKQTIAKRDTQAATVSSSLKQLPGGQPVSMYPLAYP